MGKLDSDFAPLVDDDTLAFGEEDNASGQKLAHPYVTLCHLAFRGAAIFFYLLCGWFVDSFITSFVLIVLLLSMDFWTVKNITGRLMVGLRWWNYVDDDGVSHWIFESRKGHSQNRINAAEARIFWTALIVAPAIWVLFFLVALISFKFKWLLLVCIALTLNGANLYGYMKCKMGKSDQPMTSTVGDFFKRQVFQNVKPVFLERLQRLESALATIGNEWPSFAVIPVYLLAVIAPLHQCESAEVGSTLRRFLFALSLSSAPLDCLQISVTHLSKIHALHETMMAALWEGVVHPRHVVRCATARLFSFAISNVGESMTTNRIVPALITLANDPEISVKTATIPVFGSLIINSTNKEVEDKTYFQIQNFLSDPAARDNHPTLLQLVITLGKIVAHSDSWFRDEVIIPQLAATAAFTQQLTNQTRRLDLAAALVDAFSNTVYCSLSKNTIITALLPGLKHLEQVCLQSLPEHQETVVSMIKEAESRTELPRPMERSGSSLTLSMATSNVGQGVEDMKNRVSKIFQSPMTRPTNLPNLQSIFRKK